jgi:hypothetical protein
MEKEKFHGLVGTVCVCGQEKGWSGFSKLCYFQPGPAGKTVLEDDHQSLFTLFSSLISSLSEGWGRFDSKRPRIWFFYLEE